MEAGKAAGRPEGETIILSSRCKGIMEFGRVAGRVLQQHRSWNGPVKGTVEVGRAAGRPEGECSIRLCPALIAQVTA